MLYFLDCHYIMTHLYRNLCLTIFVLGLFTNSSLYFNENAIYINGDETQFKYFFSCNWPDRGFHRYTLSWRARSN